MMRAVTASVVVLAGCYETAAVAPCTVRCNDSPCPSGLVCGSNLLCHQPGTPLCTASIDIDAATVSLRGLYVKAPNAGAGDRFGHSIALSTDGVWLVVGAPMEASNATGFDGVQTDDSLPGAGAVYIFKFDGSAYVFQTYIKSPAPDAGDQFGASVAIAANGNVIAVGVPFEDGGAINDLGDPTNDSRTDSGAVFVYDRASAVSAWVQRYYLKPSVLANDQQFGSSVALTADGTQIAVGAQGVQHRALLIKPSPTYTAKGGPQTNVSDTDHFGSSIAVSRDADTMLVGAELEDGPGTGFAGDPTLDTAQDAGAAYLYPFQSAQLPYCKASNTDAGDHFGISVATNQGSEVFVVGASGEDSGATDSNGDQADNGATDAGAVYIFERTGLASWMQKVYLKPPNTGAGDNFGRSVALTGDGAFLVVGAPGEASAEPDNQANDAAPGSGAVYAFSKSGSAWAFAAYLKASNADINDALGTSVAVSDDHAVIAAGAPHEASASVSDRIDNSAADAGAVYVFR